MNIFVLCTGRCGSVTFTKACQHMTNYTASHESRSRLLGMDRFAYPENHIEVDNRLSWLLGRLDKIYGDNAFYVHLIRNINETAFSFIKRYNKGIIKAYKSGIMMKLPKDTPPFSVAKDYCITVNTNIRLFLKDKSNKMEFKLENAKHHFRKFWSLIDAKGDIYSALNEFNITYNKS